MYNFYNKNMIYSRILIILHLRNIKYVIECLLPIVIYHGCRLNQIPYVSFLGNAWIADGILKHLGLSLTHLKRPHSGENLFETFIEVVKNKFELLDKLKNILAAG